MIGGVKHSVVLLLHGNLQLSASVLHVDTSRVLCTVERGLYFLVSGRVMSFTTVDVYLISSVNESGEFFNVLDVSLNSATFVHFPQQAHKRLVNVNVYDGVYNSSRMSVYRTFSFS